MHVRAIWTDEREDAAVLVLKSPAPADPVAVATPEPDVGDALVAWGWGKDSVGGTAPCGAEPKQLDVVPTDNCADLTPEAFDRTLICAEPSGTRNTCEGDSGGPTLTTTGQLVAITASGAGCGPDDPGTYTLVGPPLQRSEMAIPSQTEQ